MGVCINIDIYKSKTGCPGTAESLFPEEIRADV